MIDKIRKWLSPLLTIFAFGCLVLLQLGTLDKNEKANTMAFITNLIASVVIILAISAIWIPYGIDKGLLDETYRNNRDVYNEKANDISSNMLNDDLKDYCIVANARHEVDIKRCKLERYGLNLNDLSDFERFPSKYTSKQLKALKHIKNHYFKFKKLRAEVILSAREQIKGIAPQNNSGKRIGFGLTGKLLSTFLVSAFTTYLILRRKVFDINTIIQLVMWAFAIAMNIYSSITMGNSVVTVDKNNYYIDLDQVCVDFNAWLKTERPTKYFESWTIKNAINEQTKTEI